MIVPGIAGRTSLLTKEILGLKVMNFKPTFSLPSGFVNGLCCWSRPIKVLDHICCRKMSYSSWQKYGYSFVILLNVFSYAFRISSSLSQTLTISPSLLLLNF